MSNTLTFMAVPLGAFCPFMWSTAESQIRSDEYAPPQNKPDEDIARTMLQVFKEYISMTAVSHVSLFSHRNQLRDNEA